MSAKFTGRSATSLRVGQNLQLRLPCNFEAVRRAAIQLRSFLAAHNLLEKDIWACELAFAEGCNNAVQHTPAGQPGQDILVQVICSGGQVELRIDDHAVGFELPETISLPPDDRESGRGLYLIKSLMDQVKYVRTPSSNCLVLQKNVTGI